MLLNLQSFLRRGARPIARFRRAQHGATAVEFAIIAPFFLGTLVALLETAIYLFAQQTLQVAAIEASRQLMTGAAQNSSMTQAQFIQSVCPLVQPLFNCNKLMVDVQSSASFVGANASAPTLTYNAQGQVTNSWVYNPGTAGQVIVVRLIYQWSVVGGPLGFSLSNLPGNMAEMVGVSAFRVEPY